MLDMRISITWMTTGDTARTGSTLFSDPAAPRLPGWYLRAYKNEGYDDIVKYTPIPDDLVEEIAERIDCDLGTKLHPAVEAENAHAAWSRAEHIKRLRERIEDDRRALAALEAAL